MIDTSPKIPEGAMREFQDEIYYFIQMYKWGTWNTMVRIPLNEPAVLEALFDFVYHHQRVATDERPIRSLFEEETCETDATALPHQPWPFPTQPEKPAEEPTPAPTQPASQGQSYIDYVKGVVQRRGEDQQASDYERAKRVIDEQR